VTIGIHEMSSSDMYAEPGAVWILRVTPLPDVAWLLIDEESGEILAECIALS
jgi:hypothetical protein